MQCAFLRTFLNDLKLWHNFSMWFIIFQVKTIFQRVTALQQRGSPKPPGHSMRYLYFRITSDFLPLLEGSPKSVHLPMKLCVSWPWLPPSLTKHYAPFFSHPPLFSVPLPSLLSAVCFLECFSSLDFFLFILRKVFTRSSTSLPYSWGIFSFIWSLYTVVNFFYLICHCLPSSQFHCHPLSPRRWGSGMLSDSQDLRRHTTHSWDSENISGLLCPLSDLADSEWQTLQPAPGWIYFFLVLTQQLTHPSIAREPLPSALFNFLGLTSAHTFHEAWAPPAPSSSLFSFYQWGPHLCLSYIRPWRSLFLLGH